MRRLAAVLVGASALMACTGEPTSSGSPVPPPAASSKPQTPAPAQPSKEAGARYTVTLEKLDRYIRYRQASAEVKRAVEQMPPPPAGTPPGGLDLDRLQKQRELAEMPRKYGLSDEELQQLDKMVWDVTTARFSHESALLQASLKAQEQLAATLPPGPEQDSARVMIAALRKSIETGPTLHEQRARYGDANVDVLLRREQELKALWAPEDAQGARTLEAAEQRQHIPVHGTGHGESDR